MACTHNNWQFWIKYATGDSGIGLKIPPPHTCLSSHGTLCLEHRFLSLCKDNSFAFFFKTLVRHLFSWKTFPEPLPATEIRVSHLCSQSIPRLLSSAIAFTVLYHNFMRVDKFPLINCNFLRAKTAYLSISLVCNKCLKNWTELGRMSVPRCDLAYSPFHIFNVNSIPDYNFLQVFEFLDICLSDTLE